MSNKSYMLAQDPLSALYTFERVEQTEDLVASSWWASSWWETGGLVLVGDPLTGGLVLVGDPLQ